VSFPHFGPKYHQRQRQDLRSRIVAWALGSSTAARCPERIRESHEIQGLRLPRCVSTGPGVVRLAEFTNQLELKRACKDSGEMRFKLVSEFLTCGPDKRREREI
jgi:hypothetical protein